MQIRGKEVDFRVSRLKDAAALELAINNMGKKEEEIRKEKTLTAVISKTNEMFRQFFIDATGTDVLVDCEDLQESKETYTEFLRGVGEQKNKILDFSVSDIK